MRPMLEHKKRKPQPAHSNVQDRPSKLNHGDTVGRPGGPSKDSLRERISNLRHGSVQSLLLDRSDKEPYAESGVRIPDGEDNHKARRFTFFTL